jgi:hypothetical protein
VNNVSVVTLLSHLSVVTLPAATYCAIPTFGIHKAVPHNKGGAAEQILTQHAQLVVRVLSRCLV